MAEGQTPTSDERSEAWLFGVRFDLRTSDQLRAWTRAMLDGPARTCRIAFSNSEFVLEARHNDRLRRYLNTCDFNFVDSVGVAIGLSQVNGIPRPDRLSGTTFVATLCEEAALTGARLFLFGSRPGVAERAAAGLQGRAPGLQVCGVADGFAGAASVMDTIRELQPDIVSVCLGNPLQEAWIEDHLAELDLKLVWGAGGALDFYSGDVPLAPERVQRAGFEWLFRLVTNFSAARLRRQLRLAEFVALVVAARVRRTVRGGGR